MKRSARTCLRHRPSEPEDRRNGASTTDRRSKSDAGLAAVEAPVDPAPRLHDATVAAVEGRPPEPSSWVRGATPFAGGAAFPDGAPAAFSGVLPAGAGSTVGWRAVAVPTSRSEQRGGRRDGASSPAAPSERRDPSSQEPLRWREERQPFGFGTLASRK